MRFSQPAVSPGAMGRGKMAAARVRPEDEKQLRIPRPMQRQQSCYIMAACTLPTDCTAEPVQRDAQIALKDQENDL